MKKVGTLEELNVKPGDVVECVEWHGSFYTVGNKYPVVEGFGMISYSIGTKDISGKWCIVSRAPDKPKLWRDMTDAEKGALLLAHHEGEVVEFYSHYDLKWDVYSGKPVWSDNYAYRVRSEPRVETATINHWEVVTDVLKGHRITFNLIDGKPDCSSIKMESLE